ncbi:MAG: peroxide stress protein YaaA, partial [Actinobacteria bacterium]|nr:peroxide stress protein YaaA [Actinomycetota bacterium]
MHLLLPPSEGKTAGGRGRPLRSRPADDTLLGQARATTLKALRELVGGDPGAAAEALLLPSGVAAEALATNARVLDTPTTPALRRYAGVVYDGLGYADLPADQQRLAGRTVLIFSGLFGVVRGDEPVPHYR